VKEAAHVGGGGAHAELRCARRNGWRHRADPVQDALDLFRDVVNFGGKNLNHVACGIFFHSRARDVESISEGTFVGETSKTAGRQQKGQSKQYNCIKNRMGDAVP
jgi:hypothetical protein